jgi:3-oxoacyl-[acyl-carrier protein] reductase
MRERSFGRIVNTSSMNVTGGGRPGVTNYSAAKAGVIGFTRTLRTMAAQSTSIPP